jgi:AraC-like DNA-binding protein
VERATGFRNQRPVVVPRPLVAEALARPVTRRLVVIDAGVFPVAAAHGRYRPAGAKETIVILCVAGTGWVETAGSRIDVGKSTAVVLPGATGEAHAYGASEDDPWTIWWCHVRGSDAAELVGVSSSQLSKLFREATGGGVLAHHTALKMARARLLLDTTDLTIAEVGRGIGVDDQFYFSRQFRRMHGVSPRAYRAERKG